MFFQYLYLFPLSMYINAFLVLIINYLLPPSGIAMKPTNFRNRNVGDCPCPSKLELTYPNREERSVVSNRLEKAYLKFNLIIKP